MNKPKPWLVKYKPPKVEPWFDDERYHTVHWRRYRAKFLRENPLCSECGKAGKIMPATIVGHIKPVRTHPDLFWDRTNHTPLCRSCNHRTNKQ